MLVIVATKGAPPTRVPLVRSLTSIGAEESADVRVLSLPSRWAIVRRDAEGELSLRHLASGKSHELVVGAPLALDGVSVEIRAERGEDAPNEKLDVGLVSDALSVERPGFDALRALVRTTIAAANADVGALLVLDAGEPSVAVAETREGSPLGDPLALLSDTIVRDAFAAATAVRIDDASADERYRALPSVVGLRLRAVACLPMTLEGRVVAVLYLGRNGSDRPFSSGLARDLAVLSAMCVPLLVQARRERAEPRVANAGQVGLVGEHPSMIELRRLVARVAPSTLAVHVRGETGAGKEIVARALHDAGPRARLPFVALNCAAFSETLLAAELFGVKKGAFTGASHDRTGLVESVAGGTLFLDEVGDMPASMQAALLRVLERREVVRVGDTSPRPVDFRLVSATHRSLDDEVRAGRFREDLLFRLRELVIEIPPLRERGDDVLLLARLFAKLAAAEVGERVPSFEPDALRRLAEHDFPGNVRELRAVVRRAVVLADGGVVRERDLGLARATAASIPAVTDSARAPEGTLDEAWKKFAADYATRALARTGGNRERAAAELGISLRTLYRLLAER